METRKARAAGTKSPDVRLLEKTIAKFEDNPTRIPTTPELTILINAGKWTCEHLNDRRIYHKKQQAKKRAWERIAKRMLAKDEIAQIEKRVAGMSELELL